MDDYQFELLRIKAAVCSSKDSWPSPDVQVSIMGDKPTITGGTLYWSSLHACVDDARTRVTEAFAKMSAVDEDKTLSPAGKELKRKEIAEAAIASFEKSKSLVAARASVEHQMARWDEQSGLAIKPPATIAESVQLSEIRAYVSAMSDNRVHFIAKHAHDPRVVSAVLGAPAFLSGLTDADIGIVKAQVAERVAPEIAAARAETAKALQETETGWRAAIRQISNRGGLGRPHDGAEKSLRAAATAGAA
jgi:hypothetical protein